MTEIKTDGTPVYLVFSALAELKHLRSMFNIVSETARPEAEWLENDVVRKVIRISISTAVEKANCISEEIKAAIDKLQTASVLNENEEDSMREALMHISAEVAFIKTQLINKQSMIHESLIDVYYDETE